MPQDWVSKTDIINYYRCPYAFWLIDTGQASIEDVQPALLRAGEQFEGRVLSEMVPVPRTSLKKLFAGDQWLYRLPLLKNRMLRIHGRPDGVRAGDGLLEPIEIKSHSKLAASDRLELAFYWLLLSPFRTRGSRAPRGFVHLRGDVSVARPVTLKSADFDRVRELIGFVRRARREGVQPRPCSCRICSWRDEVKRLVGWRPKLSELWGMHSKCADLLPKLGVSDLDDLIKVDAAALAAQLRTQRRVVSTEVIEGWQHQARAWTTCDAIRFGTGELEFQRFILLDLEYDCTDGRLGEIWLIGLHVDDGNRRTTQILIEKSSQLSLALKKLESVLAKYSDYPVLTWSGASAELPQLHAIANVPSHLRLLETLEQRHIDVYQLAYRNIRLPVSSYRLKDVAAFFGFKPSSSILDGFEATIKYRQLRRTRSRLQRKRLRGELKSYNRDDLMRLRLVVERFSALKTEPC